MNLPPRDITLGAALRDIASGNPRSRAMAAHALGDVGDGSERAQALAALHAALTDARAEVRAEAVASLGALRDPSSLEPLWDRTQDADSIVRQSAIIALGALGNDSVFDRLVGLLHDGPADVRYQAISTLTELSPERTYPLALELLADADVQVVSAAALALGATGDGRAAGHLSGLLEHKNADIAFDAAYALAELGDARAIPVLAKHVRGGSQAWDAIAALADLSSDESLAAIAPALELRGSDASISMVAAGTILKAAAKLGAASASRAALVGRAQQTLLQGLRSFRLHVREVAITELEKHGQAWALDAVVGFGKSWRSRSVRPRLNALATRIASGAKPLQDDGDDNDGVSIANAERPVQ